MSDDFWRDAHLIHSYPRAQAIKDGFLIDVTELAREAGFSIPVAVTSAVWNDCVEWKRDETQQETGRLWDVLWMASVNARRNPDTTGRLLYELYRVPHTPKARTPRLVQLVLHIGPGDQAEPVITIMLPTED